MSRPIAHLTEPAVRKARIGWRFRYKREWPRSFWTVEGWRPTEAGATRVLARRFARNETRLDRTERAWRLPTMDDDDL